jgi:DNA mismatch repair protein MutS2
VGLISALAQAGIVPPVGPGTRLPVYRRIFTDIGDHQSIDASLSTFSGHVAALKAILIEVDGEDLVLLDELGGGTDPIEGASLAAAVLLALHRRTPRTIATTHLNQLKELAAETGGVVNASLEFDGETLAPTYRLLQGKPGRSYGLAIARRLGLPSEVLAQAEALTPEHARSVDAILEELERREAALSRREDEVAVESARLEQLQETARAKGEELAQRSAALESQEREAERTGREQARRFLLEARRRVEEALGTARAAVNEATAKEARRLVEQGVTQEAEALAKLEEEASKKGWKVRGKGKPNVAGSPHAAPSIRRSGRPDAHSVIPETTSEIDLRGMRAEEAEAEVIAALDAAVVADLPFLRIIHGKGTGALRAAVREWLAADQRVAGFALAAPEQGGSGVTIVELRA